MNRNNSLAATATALGFGTAVAMWGVGFVARIPPARVGSAPLLVILLVILLLGGIQAGRRPDGGWRLGAWTGAVASLVNLLVLGSVLADLGDGASIPAAAVWAPGSVVLGTLLGTVGGGIGRGLPPARTAGDPTYVLAVVAAVATLLLIAVGGLVTSHEAGLAVVDWPNSYGTNMFLFPLSRMVGGIFYEHSHRLIGTLVGLVTLVLFWRIVRGDERRWVRRLALGALLLVVIQGVFGGLRVTGHFTWSASAADTSPSTLLAVVHGVTGQLFFCWILVIAAVNSAFWRNGPAVRPSEAKTPESGVARAKPTAPDRVLPLLLVGGLVVQLILGGRVRHLGETALWHMTLGLGLLMLATAVSVRAQAALGFLRPIRLASRWLLAVAAAQVLLGGAALILIEHDPLAPPSGSEVFVATLHQSMGALLLGAASLVALWLRRADHDLTAPAAPPRDSPLLAQSVEP